MTLLALSEKKIKHCLMLNQTEEDDQNQGIT